MNVTARRATSLMLMNDAFSATAYKRVDMTTAEAYRSEHSPIRTQFFYIHIEGISNRVHTHFVRHHSGGQVHFVQTQRPDRIPEGNEETLRNMDILINAQSLIDMAKTRLCNRAWGPTQDVMKEIKWAIAKIDPDLAQFMVPKCVYRNGLCSEPKTCGIDMMKIYSNYPKLFEHN